MTTTTVSSPEQQQVAEGTVLAWAATTAVALGLSQPVQSALVLLVQQRFNAALSIFRSQGITASRISEDGRWGLQTVNAVLKFILVSRTPADSALITDVINAFGARSDLNVTASSLTNLRSQYTAIRDAVTAYANQTPGVMRGFVANSTALLDAVRNLTTTGDVGSRAVAFVSALFTQQSTAQATATVQSTRTAPESFDQIVSAVATPSATPPVATTSTASTVTQVDLTQDAPERVSADMFGKRVNLKILIPMAMVGTLFLVWGVATVVKKNRGRR